MLLQDALREQVPEHLERARAAYELIWNLLGALMIIVSLLDFVFRWMPWFFMCLPIPGLKGKK